MNNWKDVTNKMHDPQVKAFLKENVLIRMKKFNAMGTSYQVRKDEYYPNQWGGTFGKNISQQSGKKQSMKKVMKEYMGL